MTAAASVQCLRCRVSVPADQLSAPGRCLDPACPLAPRDPHNPHQLPAGQQLALMTLRRSDVSNAVVEKLKAGTARAAGPDYWELIRLGLAQRTPARILVLTPIGKYRADALALAAALDLGLHVFSYGRSAGAWFVRCSCGEFSNSHPTAIRDALTKVQAAAGRHLRHVASRQVPATFTAEEHLS